MIRNSIQELRGVTPTHTIDYFFSLNNNNFNNDYSQI
jgi:hypothetical protein